MEPILERGEVIARCSTSAMESEVMWEGRHYMLFVPFCNKTLRHIESLEATLRERRQGPLINNFILYEELTMLDSLGNVSSCDVILQELPAGMPFDRAIHHYKRADLRVAVNRMKSRLDAVGFRHNNLRPTNVWVCDSGVVRPLRYWYAEWEEFSDNNISQLMKQIDKCQCLEASKYHLVDTTDGEEPKMAFLSDIIRDCRGGHYGFIDRDGRQVMPFIYSWASEFYEGRAIVARCGKMGAIDCCGRKVVHVVYSDLKFDVETGMFVGMRGKYRYLLNYDGKIIRKELISFDDKRGAGEHIFYIFNL